MAVLGYLPKLKWGLGLAFGALFFNKNVPYLILYQWEKSQCHNLFLSQDIKEDVLIIWSKSPNSFGSLPNYPQFSQSPK